MIKDSKTTVSFITERGTKAQILRLIEAEKRNGRKVTFSQYINQLVIDHIELKKLFNSWIVRQSITIRGKLEFLS